MPTTHEKRKSRAAGAKAAELASHGLDAIDLRILDALQQDGRLTNVDLARRVNLSPSPCLARVRALEADGVIGGRVTLLDPRKVGLGVSVFVQITLERFIVQQLSKLPGVANIRSSFALKQVKYKTALPLSRFAAEADAP